MGREWTEKDESSFNCLEAIEDWHEEEEEKIQNAKKIMEFAHKGQFRKDGVTPYSIHPETVVKTLKLLGVEDSDILCAGYLHDVLEDTTYSAEKIQKNFGDKVLNIVNELTFDNDITDEEYWDGCQSMSLDAKWVKLADILTNLGDKGEKSNHFVQKRVEALKRLLSELPLNHHDQN
jgi:(p)ppGpp synthase/HD superfamily hydrolase